MRASLTMVVGTRPEAIKCAPVVFALRERGLPVRLVASGQHAELLDTALADFGLVADVNLRVMQPGQDLAGLTARLLTSLDAEFAASPPRMVLVQGDTTTAFAAALSAFYRRIPCGHIEAGLRSGNRVEPFPEDLNRQLADRLCTRHWAPTARARDALRAEGVNSESIVVTGQTGVDAALWMAARVGSAAPQELAAALKDRRPRLVLATGHRRENQQGGIAAVAAALADRCRTRGDLTVLFAAHPSPAVQAQLAGLQGTPGFHVLPPLSYRATVWMLAHADAAVSDSGGLQEEAPSFGLPVLVTRGNTERPEALESGFLRLVGCDAARVKRELDDVLDDQALRPHLRALPNPYGDGQAATRIAADLAALPEPSP
ncbi:MAG: UDP-N-acetylglucosamine 2-epimerase (non-hydrolyzing) [Planctomycetes bacterium]|nr:UDP-N-acetylglucosamine 2-epimerase (non-hydrolyzing) [Planctomycetota bacterium]